jgi:TonB family protein
MVFLRMDAPITSSTSAFMEKRLSADEIILNDERLTKITACSLFILDTSNADGTYFLRPPGNKETLAHKKITVHPRKGSITFIKLSLAPFAPYISTAEEVDSLDFVTCYENNKWLQKRLKAAGYNSMKELTDGFVVNTRELTDAKNSARPVMKRSAIGDTTFYNRNSEISLKDSATFYRLITPDKDGYSVNAYYILNNLQKMAGHYSSTDSEKKEGTFLEYSQKGILTSRGNYLDGYQTGSWEYFHDTLNGPLWYTCPYVDGWKQGELKSYYLSGKLKRTELHERMEIPQRMSPRNKVKMAIQYVDSVVSGTCYDENGNNIPFTRFEIVPKPTFDMFKYLSANLHYPHVARDRGIEGRVVVRFIVNENGTLSNVHVVKHVSPDIDEEAERVVLNMPPWKPGIRDDKPAKIFFNLPLVFKLD